MNTERPDHYKTKKYVHSPNDVPQEEHYAILEFGSISIPGDERSRTNPGHGYPASVESKTDYIVFTDKASWLHEIELRLEGKYRPNDNWAPVIVRRAKITTKVEVN